MSLKSFFRNPKVKRKVHRDVITMIVRMIEKRTVMPTSKSTFPSLAIGPRISSPSIAIIVKNGVKGSHYWKMNWKILTKQISSWKVFIYWSSVIDGMLSCVQGGPPSFCHLNLSSVVLDLWFWYLIGLRSQVAGCPKAANCLIFPLPPVVRDVPQYATP